MPKPVQKEAWARIQTIAEPAVISCEWHAVLGYEFTGRWAITYQKSVTCHHWEELQSRCKICLGGPWRGLNRMKIEFGFGR